MNPVNILHALIVWQSLLFSIVLFTPKFRKRRSNIFLAFLLLTFGIHFSYNILFTNEVLLDLLPAFSCSYGFLYGPLLFLFTRHYLFKDIKFKPVDTWHFVPFVIIIIATSMGHMICGPLKYFILPSMMVYCIFSYREILIYRKSLIHVSSKAEGSHTRWIETMLIVMIFIVCLNLVQMRWPQFSFAGIQYQTEFFVQLLVFLLINIIVYQGLRSPQNFQRINTADISLGRSQRSEKEIAIDLSELQKPATQVDAYMKENQPYLNPDLSLSLLSEMTNIHERILSRAINTVLKSNFSDYVNGYRIRMVRSELEKSGSPSISIKELMYAAGFNSRSVFNTFFKKVTGLTPTEYRDKYSKRRSDS